MPNRPHTLIESWLLFDAIGAESLHDANAGPNAIRAQRPLWTLPAGE
jgi:hypothetical protein